MSEMKDRLKELRKTLDLKQREVAEKLGVRTGDVGGWESGRNIPDSRLRLLCKEYNVRREWLETGVGEMFEPKADTAKLLADVDDEEIFIESMRRKFKNLSDEKKSAFLSFCRDQLDEQRREEAAKTPKNQPAWRNEFYSTVARNDDLDDARNA